jgi:hypothetical protein
MAILLGTDCTTNRLGTGMESCQPIEGLPSGLILTTKGWSLSKTSGTFNLTYVKSKILDGTFIPMVGCFEAVSETPDATTEESQSGIMQVVRQGKPNYTFTFKDGLAGHKARFSYNSFGQYDVLLVYESGVIKCSESVDGTSIKGFDAGMLNTNGYSENNGTNSASSVLRFQLKNPQEFNLQAQLLTDLDFNPNTELNGITDVVLKGTADASDNKIYVSATWLHNEQLNFTFFTDTQIDIAVNGVAGTITTVTYNTTTKKYEITPTTALTAGQSVVVSIPAVAIGNKFYRGISSAITVSA